LCCVDVFSRKAFVSAIKRKSDSTEAVRNILANDKPIVIQSDNGTEFLNNSFRTLLKSMNVRHITVAVGDKKKQRLVERFNRTIALVIIRYQESRNTNRYIEVLEDIVYSYNHTYHRAINDSPENRFGTNPNTGTFKVYTLKELLRFGDRVRILNNKTAFRKGYEPTFGKYVYQIYEGDGYTFGLRDEFGALLDRMYKVYELQKVTAVENYTIRIVSENDI
jgi:ribosomal protein S24E